MAQIKFGGGIIEMRGSVAGNTFSRNGTGNYMRARTTPTNPKTARQNHIRAVMGVVASAWAQTLSPAQRLAWKVFAMNMPEKNKVGETYYGSAYMQYVRCNIAAINAGLPEILDGPTVFVRPDQDPVLEGELDETNQEVTVAFDDTLDYIDEDDAGMHIYVGVPQNPSVEYFDGPWRYAATILGDSVTPLTSPQQIATPWPVAEGQRVWIEARIQRADGRVSETFRHTAIVVT